MLERRFPGIPVTVLPVAVQGQEAAPQIVSALERANRSGLFDVLIVGRGGGSLEDLWPFNEEIVARAIAKSALPIVSAVGHEVDFTIADFVADERAPTPSAAAEMLSPDGEDWLQTFAGFEILLEQIMQRQVQQQRQKVEWLRSRLRHPGERLQNQQQSLDNLDLRLQKAIQQTLARQGQTLKQVALRQQRFHPKEKIQAEQTRLKNLNQRLTIAAQSKLQRAQQQFTANAKVLNAVSPLNTLERGYAIVRDKEGHVIGKASDTKVGATIQAKLADGELTATVEAVAQ